VSSLGDNTSVHYTMETKCLNSSIDTNPKLSRQDW